MNIDLAAAREKDRNDIVAAIKEILADFPILEKHDLTIHIAPLSKYFSSGNNRRYASFRYQFRIFKIKQEIKLNPDLFQFPDITSEIKKATDANYESIKDIIWHEIGHSLQFYMVFHYYNLNPNRYFWHRRMFKRKLTETTECTMCYQWHMDHYLSQFNWDKKTMERLLGSYAANDCSEFIPECFNNYYRLKAKPSWTKEDSKTFKFVKTVVTDYQTYIPNNKLA